MKIFYEFCEKNKIEHNPDKIFGYLNEFEDKTAFEQLSFFKIDKDLINIFFEQFYKNT